MGWNRNQKPISEHDDVPVTAMCLCKHYSSSLLDPEGKYHYYTELINCIKQSVETTVPLTKTGIVNNHNVTGWTDFVSAKHDIARQAFLDWVADGKSRSGVIYQHM